MTKRDILPKRDNDTFYSHGQPKPRPLKSDLQSLYSSYNGQSDTEQQSSYKICGIAKDSTAASSELKPVPEHEL